MTAKSPTLRNYFKAGFGTGGGFLGALAGFMLIALIFFIPGFIIISKENKKPKSERSDAMIALGLCLMFMGVIAGGGAFLGDTLNALKNQF